MRVMLSILLLSIAYISGAQGDIIGTWKAIDDVDGQPSSHIEIYEDQGKVHGKITKILKDVEGEAICDRCDGDKKDQPIVGLEIIWDMEDSGKSYKGGRILDPENGKTYKCRIKLVEGILEVRGYIGVPAIGRTQKWYPVD